MSCTLNHLKRYMAFICPDCYEICERDINIFECSSFFEASCPSECSESCISISRDKGKFKVFIECPACGDTHTFDISVQSFMQKNNIFFSCPEWNLRIFFLGKDKKSVHDEANLSRLMLLEIEKEFDDLIF